jgi:hypothetical protein
MVSLSWKTDGKRSILIGVSPACGLDIGAKGVSLFGSSVPGTFVAWLSDSSRLQATANRTIKIISQMFK